MMKFSIIIPVYNKQGYLELTLQSVIAQKFTYYEVIVIDDGSTDDSVAVVRQFKDPRVKLIQQKNSGVSVARNRGINEATGEWVCFLDADDWYHPDYLSELAAMSQAFPECDVMATRFVPMPDKVDWAPTPWVMSGRDYELIENLPARWLRGIPFFTSSIAIRRNVLNSMQPCFPAGENSGEDLDVWFRLAEKSPIILLRQPLVAYRTFVASGLSVTSHHGVNAPYLARMALRAQSLPDELKRSTLDYITHFYITAARMSATSGKRVQALKLLKKEWSRGVTKRRWWVTLVMVLVMSAKFMHYWQSWRESRTQAQVD